MASQQQQQQQQSPTPNGLPPTTATSSSVSTLTTTSSTPATSAAAAAPAAPAVAVAATAATTLQPSMPQSAPAPAAHTQRVAGAAAQHRPRKKPRRRYARACAHCQLRKRRCGGGNPCERCVVHGVPCTYAEKTGSSVGSQHILALFAAKCSRVDTLR